MNWSELDFYCAPALYSANRFGTEVITSLVTFKSIHDVFYVFRMMLMINCAEAELTCSDFQQASSCSMPLVAVEGNSKLCSIANYSVPALGVNDENMLRRYVYISLNLLWISLNLQWPCFQGFETLAAARHAYDTDSCSWCKWIAWTWVFVLSVDLLARDCQPIGLSLGLINFIY